MCFCVFTYLSEDGGVAVATHLDDLMLGDSSEGKQSPRLPHRQISPWKH